MVLVDENGISYHLVRMFKDLSPYSKSETTREVSGYIVIPA